MLGLRREKEEYREDGKSNLQAYFRRLYVRLIIGLLAAFILPHMALSAYFHFQFTNSLKNTGKLNLEAISKSLRDTIDLFIQERVVNLFSVFHSSEFALAPTTESMHLHLQSLRRASESFIDIGVLDADGTQTAYAGPYPFLQGKNYNDEPWFRDLMDTERAFTISDIYLGFRNKPHFTIAVRQTIDGRYHVLKSTLDPDKFYMFLRSISHGKEVETALINDQGQYQVVDPDQSALLGLGDHIPPKETPSGVIEVSKEGDTILIAYAWLREVPWALKVRQPLAIAHAGMYRTRRIMTTSLAVILAVLTALIWFATKRLIDGARATAEKREELSHQLVHASKLASIGELATGVAHEINNPLAIITATSGVVRDLLDPEFGLDSSPEIIKKELDKIDAAAFRARKITRQLLDLGRDNLPKSVPTNINAVLEDTLDGFKERSLLLSDIKIVRDFAADLPEMPLDPELMRQVFLNLVNNAGDAIQGPGTITITTARDGDYIKVIVEDTGTGLAQEQMSKIFNPFFTTKEEGKGTGLGLSISLSIVESLGGTISVQSLKGMGCSFTVSLPVNPVIGNSISSYQAPSIE